MPNGPILVVEDHDDSREMLAQMLELWGYTVATAESIVGAVALLVGGLEPRVILLDLMVPGVSGWDLLKSLRADLRFRRIPVIVVTGVAPTVLKEHPLVGADAVVFKPFDHDALERVVRGLAGEPS